MVTTDGHRKFPILGMTSYHLCYCLCHSGNKARVLQDADGRVAGQGGADIFKLVVSVELDIPPKVFQLLNDACVDNVDGPLIDTSLGLWGV